jgi:plastocyanin
MKKYILLLLIVALLISGCKKAEIQEPEVEEIIEEVEELPQVPEDWEGKTIKELLEEGNAPDIIDDTVITDDLTENDTDEEPQEVLPEGITKVSLQVYGDLLQFFPNTVTISKGDTVRWVNELDYHDKKARVSVYAHHNRLFRSPSLVYGDYFEFQFNETGTYTYGAVPYESLFKRGTVIVE